MNGKEELRLIPLHLIKKPFGENFIFLSNFGFKSPLLKGFSNFYKANIYLMERFFLTFSQSFKFFKVTDFVVIQTY